MTRRSKVQAGPVRSMGRLGRMSLGSMRANVRRAWAEATRAELETGVRWYPRAHADAARLADETGRSLESAAGVLAALSPGTDWDRNVADAVALMRGVDGHRCGTYPANVAKARRIIAGADPRAVLGGRKVRAFFECIVDPTRADDVCIDRHALGVAAGRRVDPNVGSHWLERAGSYDRVASVYRRVAAELGVRPCEVQAVTWNVWRERFGGRWRTADGWE